MPELSIPVTTALTSGLVIWLLILTAMVVRARQTSGQSLGDGGDVALTRAIRAQANLTEYAPLFVALILVGELQGGNFGLLAGLAGIFFAARISHGFALAFTTSNAVARGGGFLFTVIPLAIGAVYNLILLAG